MPAIPPLDTFDNGCCPPCPERNPSAFPARRRHQCADPAQPVDLRHTCNHEPVFLNNAQSFTASCPSGFEGEPVSVTVPAETVPSRLSQSDADAQALAIAQDTAEAELACQGLYFNSEQTATVKCPFGLEQQATVPAGVYSSNVDQQTANALAYAAAAEQAQSQCTA